MAFDFLAHMAEATRLTRAGRLADATALLQSKTVSAHSANADASKASGGDIIDLVPTRSGSADWIDPGLATPRLREMPRPEGLSDMKMPAVIGGVIKRLKSFSDRQMPGIRTKSSVSVPDDARFEQHSFSNEAGERDYKLYVPGQYNGTKLPLVIMLHGCTQSPDDFAAGTQMNQLAEELGFLVGYPAQPTSANQSKCWNWYNPADQLPGTGEPSLIAGITRQIMRDFAVDATRVYIAGLSAGGAAAAIMGASYPGLYAAIGVHSGLACGAAKDMLSAFAAMRHGGPVHPSDVENPRPTIVFHGDGDNTVSPVNGDQVIAQAKASRAFVLTVASGKSPGGVAYNQHVYANASGQTMLEQWVLQGLGHAWSGGSNAGTYTDPRGPDASREMMRFFLQHRNPPSDFK